MENENTRGDAPEDAPEMEDYGSPATDKDPSLTRPDGSGSDSNLGTLSGNQGMYSSEYSGGTAGTEQGSGEGEQFGEFGNTNTGTDLTIEMENTDVRTGMVKGGTSGADDVVGPGAYGGEAGGVTDR